MRLRRLSSSPVSGLTSAAVWPLVVSGGARLPHLGLSRPVPFTDRFTDRVPDKGFLVLLGASARHRSDHPLVLGETRNVSADPEY